VAEQILALGRKVDQGVMAHALDPVAADRLWDEAIPRLIRRPLPLQV
jgi:hypothetical protein